MTAREAAELLGREGFLAVGELQVAVRVVDAARNWGRTHLTVAPIAGTGQQTVDSQRVRLLPRGQSAVVALADNDGDLRGLRLATVG